VTAANEAHGGAGSILRSDANAKEGVVAIRTVGIDLAIRGSHVATILDDNGEILGQPIRFRLRHQELKKLIRKIRKDLLPTDRVIAVLEPTGMAWFPVSQWLQRAGCEVIRVKGQRVKALRRYLSEHAKTDVLDAQVLGSVPSFGGKGLTPLFLPSAQQHALNRLTKQRSRYREEISSILRRLKDFIRWANPGLEAALPPLNTQVSLAVLEKLFNPRTMRRTGERRLIAFLDKHVGGKHPAHSSFTQKLAEDLQDAARETIKLYPARDVDFALLQLEMRQEIGRLRFYRKMIQRLDEEIERLYAALHPEDHLRTIPGVGKVIAPSLLGVLHTWERFGREKRIRGYTGLFPRRRESGGQDSPSQRIAKSGNNQLKRDLALAADVARKFDPGLALVYRTMMVDKGKHHKQALCAVAIRLANRIATILREGRPYVLRDIDGRDRAIIEARYKVPANIRFARKKAARSEKQAA
jgi:transposase